MTSVSSHVATAVCRSAAFPLCKVYRNKTAGSPSHVNVAGVPNTSVGRMRRVSLKVSERAFGMPKRR
jgi:hypothetical protein